MKNICQILIFLVFLIATPGIIKGQTALSIDEKEANFGKYNNNFRGWVRAERQLYYNVATKRIGDELKKDGKASIYGINIFYTKKGAIERVEGPGLQTVTYKYNDRGDVIVVDRTGVGDYDEKYIRKITNYIYDSSGRLLEKTESNIPYRLSGGKAVYDYQKPDVRTRTVYRYNDAGRPSEFIVYENQGELIEVYREVSLYDNSGFLTQKTGTDRDGYVSMKEEYTYGKRTKTEYTSKKIINRRIIYDDKERPLQEIGLGAGDVITFTKFKYNDEGRLLEWISHDALGNPKSIYTGVENPPYSVREVYQYDMAGNRVGWSFYDEEGNVLDRYFVNVAYDKRGNWLKKAMVENHIGLDKFVIVERTIEYY